MTESYITISECANKELVIRKSRFIGYVAPCQEEEEALSYLKKIHDLHKSASHHCYAYVIGANANIMRYSDNGEPAGTAGMPIMDVLRNNRIVNACIVVVRYFGGVLLGTGGLVRAYTQSAQSAVDKAGLVRMERTTDILCQIPYPAWDKFRYSSEMLPVQIQNVTYESQITFHLLIRHSEREDLIRQLIDASGRKLAILDEQDQFIPWKLL